MQIADFDKRGGDLLTYLFSDHTTLRVPTAGSDLVDCPIHPLWRDLQKRAASFGMEGATRHFPQRETWEQRQLRNVISVEGYVKNYAALSALLTGEAAISHEEAMQRLMADLRKGHDPISWERELLKRMKRIELGQ